MIKDVCPNTFRDTAFWICKLNDNWDIQPCSLEDWEKCKFNTEYSNETPNSRMS